MLERVQETAWAWVKARSKPDSSAKPNAGLRVMIEFDADRFAAGSIRKPDAAHTNNSLIKRPLFTNCTGRPVFVCRTCVGSIPILV